MNRFLDVYWIIYFLGYLAATAIMLWLQWDGLLHEDNRIHLLAAIFGAAAGSASAFAIIIEGGGRIVLLIPREIKRLKRQGRMERDARYREALKRFGVEKDGVVTITFTPEVWEFLNTDTGDADKSGE